MAETMKLQLNKLAGWIDAGDRNNSNRSAGRMLPAFREPPAPPRPEKNYRRATVVQVSFSFLSLKSHPSYYLRVSIGEGHYSQQPNASGPADRHGARTGSFHALHQHRKTNIENLYLKKPKQ